MESSFKLTDQLLAAAVPSCRLSDLADPLVAMVNDLGSRLSFPLVINSAYRSADWDRRKGRSGNSAHCSGLAVDVRCVTSRQRFEIIYHAIRTGFRRIGVGRNFIHLDCDFSKPQSTIWTYYTK